MATTIIRPLVWPVPDASLSNNDSKDEQFADDDHRAFLQQFPKRLDQYRAIAGNSTAAETFEVTNKEFMLELQKLTNALNDAKAAYSEMQKQKPAPSIQEMRAFVDAVKKQYAALKKFKEQNQEKMEQSDEFKRQAAIVKTDTDFLRGDTYWKILEKDVASTQNVLEKNSRETRLAELKKDWQSHGSFADFNSERLNKFYADLLEAKEALNEGIKNLNNIRDEAQRAAEKKYLDAYQLQLAELEKQVINSMYARLRAAEEYSDPTCDDVTAMAYDQAFHQLDPKGLPQIQREKVVATGQLSVRPAAAVAAAEGPRAEDLVVSHFDLGQLQARAVQIEEMNQDLLELNQMFKDVALLVDIQGKGIEHILKRVNLAKRYAEDGYKYLLQAEKQQKARYGDTVSEQGGNMLMDMYNQVNALLATQTLISSPIPPAPGVNGTFGAWLYNIYTMLGGVIPPNIGKIAGAVNDGFCDAIVHDLPDMMRDFFERSELFGRFITDSPVQLKAEQKAFHIEYQAAASEVRKRRAQGYRSPDRAPELPAAAAPVAVPAASASAPVVAAGPRKQMTRQLRTGLTPALTKSFYTHIENFNHNQRPENQLDLAQLQAFNWPADWKFNSEAEKSLEANAAIWLTLNLLDDEKDPDKKIIRKGEITKLKDALRTRPAQIQDITANGEIELLRPVEEKLKKLKEEFNKIKSDKGINPEKINYLQGKIEGLDKRFQQIKIKTAIRLRAAAGSAIQEFIQNKMETNQNNDDEIRALNVMVEKARRFENTTRGELATANIQQLDVVSILIDNIIDKIKNNKFTTNYKKNAAKILQAFGIGKIIPLAQIEQNLNELQNLYKVMLDKSLFKAEVLEKLGPKGHFKPDELMAISVNKQAALPADKKPKAWIPLETVNIFNGDRKDPNEVPKELTSFFDQSGLSKVKTTGWRAQFANDKKKFFANFNQISALVSLGQGKLISLDDADFEAPIQAIPILREELRAELDEINMKLHGFRNSFTMRFAHGRTHDMYKEWKNIINNKINQLKQAERSIMAGLLNKNAIKKYVINNGKIDFNKVANIIKFINKYSGNQVEDLKALKAACLENEPLNNTFRSALAAKFDTGSEALKSFYMLLTDEEKNQFEENAAPSMDEYLPEYDGSDNNHAPLFSAVFPDDSPTLTMYATKRFLHIFQKNAASDFDEVDEKLLQDKPRLIAQFNGAADATQDAFDMDNPRWYQTLATGMEKFGKPEHVYAYRGVFLKELLMLATKTGLSAETSAVRDREVKKLIAEYKTVSQVQRRVPPPIPDAPPLFPFDSKPGREIAAELKKLNLESSLFHKGKKQLIEAEVLSTEQIQALNAEWISAYLVQDKKLKTRSFLQHELNTLYKMNPIETRQNAFKKFIGEENQLRFNVEVKSLVTQGASSPERKEHLQNTRLIESFAPLDVVYNNRVNLILDMLSKPDTGYGNYQKTRNNFLKSIIPRSARDIVTIDGILIDKDIVPSEQKEAKERLDKAIVSQLMTEWSPVKDDIIKNFGRPGQLETLHANWFIRYLQINNFDLSTTTEEYKQLDARLTSIRDQRNPAEEFKKFVGNDNLQRVNNEFKTIIGPPPSRASNKRDAKLIEDFASADNKVNYRLNRLEALLAVAPAEFDAKAAEYLLISPAVIMMDEASDATRARYHKFIQDNLRPWTPIREKLFERFFPDQLDNLHCNWFIDLLRQDAELGIVAIDTLEAKLGELGRLPANERQTQFRAFVGIKKNNDENHIRVEQEFKAIVNYSTPGAENYQPWSADVATTIENFSSSRDTVDAYRVIRLQALFKMESLDVYEAKRSEFLASCRMPTEPILLDGASRDQLNTLIDNNLSPWTPLKEDFVTRFGTESQLQNLHKRWMRDVLTGAVTGEAELKLRTKLEEFAAIKDKANLSKMLNEFMGVENTAALAKELKTYGTNLLKRFSAETADGQQFLAEFIRNEIQKRIPPLDVHALKGRSVNEAEVAAVSSEALMQRMGTIVPLLARICSTLGEPLSELENEAKTATAQLVAARDMNLLTKATHHTIRSDLDAAVQWQRGMDEMLLENPAERRRKIDERRAVLASNRRFANTELAETKHVGSPYEYNYEANPEVLFTHYKLPALASHRAYAEDLAKAMDMGKLKTLIDSGIFDLSTRSGKMFLAPHLETLSKLKKAGKLNDPGNVIGTLRAIVSSPVDEIAPDLMSNLQRGVPLLEVTANDAKVEGDVAINTLQYFSQFIIRADDAKRYIHNQRLSVTIDRIISNYIHTRNELQEPIDSLFNLMAGTAEKYPGFNFTIDENFRKHMLETIRAIPARRKKQGLETPLSFEQKLALHYTEVFLNAVPPVTAKLLAEYKSHMEATRYMMDLDTEIRKATRGELVTAKFIGTAKELRSKLGDMRAEVVTQYQDVLVEQMLRNIVSLDSEKVSNIPQNPEFVKAVVTALGTDEQQMRLDRIINRDVVIIFIQDLRKLMHAEPFVLAAAVEFITSNYDNPALATALKNIDDIAAKIFTDNLIKILNEISDRSVNNTPRKEDNSNEVSLSTKITPLFKLLSQESQIIYALKANVMQLTAMVMAQHRADPVMLQELIGRVGAFEANFADNPAISRLKKTRENSIDTVADHLIKAIKERRYEPNTHAQYELILKFGSASARENAIKAMFDAVVDQKAENQAYKMKLLKNAFTGEYDERFVLALARSAIAETTSKPPLNKLFEMHVKIIAMRLAAPPAVAAATMKAWADSTNTLRRTIAKSPEQSEALKKAASDIIAETLLTTIITRNLSAKNSSTLGVPNDVDPNIKNQIDLVLQFGSETKRLYLCAMLMAVLEKEAIATDMNTIYRQELLKAITGKQSEHSQQFFIYNLFKTEYEKLAMDSPHRTKEHNKKTYEFACKVVQSYNAQVQAQPKAAAAPAAPAGPTSTAQIATLGVAIKASPELKKEEAPVVAIVAAVEVAPKKSKEVLEKEWDNAINAVNLKKPQKRAKTKIQLSPEDVKMVVAIMEAVKKYLDKRFTADRPSGVKASKDAFEKLALTDALPISFGSKGTNGKFLPKDFIEEDAIARDYLMKQWEGTKHHDTYKLMALLAIYRAANQVKIEPTAKNYALFKEAVSHALEHFHAFKDGSNRYSGSSISGPGSYPDYLAAISLIAGVPADKLKAYGISDGSISKAKEFPEFIQFNKHAPQVREQPKSQQPIVGGGPPANRK